MTRKSPTVPAADAPTTLIEHGWLATSTNCLASALQNGRDDGDEAVFLGSSDLAGAAGHVVLRDTWTDLVREPDAAFCRAAGTTVGAYTAASGLRFICSVPVTLLRSIVALAPSDRLAAMRHAGGRLPEIAHVAFAGRVTSSPGPQPHQTPENNNGGRGKPPDTGNDKHVHDWLDTVGNLMSDSDKNALAQNGDDAKKLLGWFDSHSRGDPKISSDMPKDVREGWDRLLANDSTSRLINDDKGKTTRDKLGDFLKQTDQSADHAKDAFKAFKDSNKTPDPIAASTAVDASILQANEPVLDGGTKGAPLDQRFDVRDLQSVATGDDNKNLVDPLKHAAGLFATSGQFSNLGNSGLQPQETNNGTVNNNNLDALVKKGINKDEEASIADLQSKGLHAAVADAHGDASKVGADYYNGGKSEASGADKADALLKMGDAIGRYRAGEAKFNPNLPALNPPSYTGDGASPGQRRDDFVKDLQKHIDQLSNDPDVAKFMSDKVPAALQGMVSSDPNLKASMERKLADSSSGKALGDAFGGKGPDGKPLSTTDALNAFAAKPSFYASTLGEKANLTKAIGDAPKDVEDKINTGFDTITSGKEIDDLVAHGMPRDKAVVQSAANKVAYDAVLDPAKVEDGTNKFNDAAAKMGRFEVTDGKSGDELLKGLGITDLNGTGPNSLEAFINAHPEQFTGPAGHKSSTSSIANGVRALVEGMRHGAKFDDVLQKVTDNPSFLPKDVTDTYKAGVLHGASGLLLAGGIALRMTVGGGNPADVAAPALNTAGLLLEGGGKYYQSSRNDLKNGIIADEKRLADFRTQGVDYAPLQAKIDADKKALKSALAVGKDVETVGKAIGGVGGNVVGLVFGALSAKTAIANGDKVGAGLSGSLAGLNGISAVTSTAEVISATVPRVAQLLGATLPESVSGPLGSLGIAAGLGGAVAGVAGGALAIGGALYAVITGIKHDNQERTDKKKWYDETSSEFKNVGITVPDQETLVSPPNGSFPGPEAVPIPP